MLPTPASHRDRAKPRIFFPSSRDPQPSSPVWQTLRNRSRLTNLAVALVLSLLCASLLLNLRAYLSYVPKHAFAPFSIHPARYRGWEDNATPEQLDSGVPLSIETTVERDPRFTELDHLIMVPGHAIWVGHNASRVGEDEEWVLEPMQKGGSVRTYVKHIEEGVERLRADPKSLLVFSGGATRKPPSPPLPEALSYLFLATALALLPSQVQHGSNVGEPHATAALPLSARAVTEEYALDSYENLLFGIARFKEVTGRWPASITVVGYGMKQNRFEHLHRAVIGFPAEHFRYVGVDDEGDTTEHYAGEHKYGYTPFLSSPSGCHPPLSIKRQIRNPYFRYHPYHTSCPEIVELLEWCPPQNPTVPDDAEGMAVFDGPLPWRIRSGEEGVSWGREKEWRRSEGVESRA